MNFELVIYLLIQILLVAGVCWLVLWACEKAGIALPERVVQIAWAIAVLIVILLLYRMLAPVLNMRVTSLLPVFA